MSCGLPRSGPNCGSRPPQHRSERHPPRRLPRGPPRRPARGPMQGRLMHCPPKRLTQRLTHRLPHHPDRRLPRCPKLRAPGRLRPGRRPRRRSNALGPLSRRLPDWVAVRERRRPGRPRPPWLATATTPAAAGRWLSSSGATSSALPPTPRLPSRASAAAGSSRPTCSGRWPRRELRSGSTARTPSGSTAWSRLRSPRSRTTSRR
jgi:hypothetical protein